MKLIIKVSWIFFEATISIGIQMLFSSICDEIKTFITGELNILRYAKSGKEFINEGYITRRCKVYGKKHEEIEELTPKVGSKTEVQLISSKMPSNTHFSTPSYVNEVPKASSWQSSAKIFQVQDDFFKSLQADFDLH